MSPPQRRRAAAILLGLSILIGWPVSWILPDIGDPWFGRVLSTWASDAMPPRPSAMARRRCSLCGRAPTARTSS